jgi:hypothetical protein
LTKTPFPNLAVLAKHDDLLVRYAMLAERYIFDDPNSSLIKQRRRVWLEDLESTLDEE